jgi:serine/threonine protein kinase
VVYRCVQPGLSRLVAVKVRTVTRDERHERLVREQQSMGRLTGHPNIVAVLRSVRPRRATPISADATDPQDS